MPTQIEFITSIRQKYPQYQDIDDSTLVAKIVEKYPIYQDQISDFGQPLPTETIEEPATEIQQGKTDLPAGATFTPTKDYVPTFKPSQRLILTDRQEAEFQKNWKENPNIVEWKKELGGEDKSPDDPEEKYDYRKAWLNGDEPQINPEDGKYHWGSVGKDIDHPTYDKQFSISNMKPLQAGEIINYDDGSFPVKERKLGVLRQTANNFISNTWGLVDIAGGAFILSGLNEEFGKQMRDYSKKIQSKYRAPLAEKGFELEDLKHPSWYLVNAAGLIPMMTALVPLSMAGGAGGAAVAATFKLGKWTGMGVTAMSSALASRPVESTIEAIGTYNELIDQGVSKEKAAEAAAGVFTDNMTLIGMDAAQYALAFAKVHPALRQSIGKWISSTGARAVGFAAASASEGWEEVIQGYFQALGQASAKGEAAPDLVKALKLSSPESKKEFVLGTMMGLGFQTAGAISGKDVLTDEDINRIIDEQIIISEVNDGAEPADVKEQKIVDALNVGLEEAGLGLGLEEEEIEKPTAAKKDIKAEPAKLEPTAVTEKEEKKAEPTEPIKPVVEEPKKVDVDKLTPKGDIGRMELEKAGFDPAAAGFGEYAEIKTFEGKPVIALHRGEQGIDGFAVHEDYQKQGIAAEYISKLVKMDGRVDFQTPNENMLKAMKKAGTVTEIDKKERIFRVGPKTKELEKATTENINEFLGKKLELGTLGKDATGYFVQNIETGKKDRIAPSQAVNYVNEKTAPIKPKTAEKPKEAPIVPKVEEKPAEAKPPAKKAIAEPTIKEDKQLFTDIYKDIEKQAGEAISEGKMKLVPSRDGRGQMEVLDVDIKSGRDFKIIDNIIKIKSPQGEYEFAVPTTKAELKDLKLSISEAFKQDKGFVKVTFGIRKRTPVMESLRVLEDKNAPPARVKTAQALLKLEGIGFKKGAKEAKSKAEHQDHKQNPYTPGTLEWKKWNEAWQNYDSLEQEPTKLHSGLPFHLLIPEKIRRKARTFFEPFANIPEGQDALLRRYELLGELDKADDFIKMVSKELDTFDVETKKDMFKFLDGQISLNDLPTEARAVAKRTQKRLINIGQMLVKRDIISKETFDRLKGKYVPYMYAKHVIGDEATTRLNPGGGLDLSYTIARNPDLTTKQKQALGQIEDASIVVPAGMGKALTDIAKFDYYADIAKNPNLVWTPSLIEVNGKKVGIGKLIEEVKTFSKMAEQFPDNKQIIERHDELKEALDKSRVDTKNAPNDFKAMPVSKTYGDLSGAYIRKPIADDILPLIGTKVGERGDLFGTFAKIEQQGVALHKMGKVALNPPTVFRNVISNFMQNNMRGRALAYIPGDLVKASRSILKKDKFYKESKKYGLFRTNWSVTEIKNVIEEFAGVDPGNWGTFYKAVSNVSKYYGKIDDIAKHTIYVQLRSDGVPAEKAILEAHKWGMDYSLGSRSIKELRRHVMPFTTYQYKIAPLIAESIAKRPWVIGKFLLIPALMKEAAQQLNDISDDDWEKLKSQLPNYVKDNKTYMVIPFKNNEGKWQFVNLEYYFPWGNQLAIIKDISKGQWDEVVKNSGIGNPFLDLFRGLVTNKDPFTQKQIINPVDSPAEQWLSAAEFLSSRFVGSAFTSYGALGLTVKVGEENSWGNKITAPQAIGRWLGWNVITVDRKMSAIMKKKKIRELTGNFLKIKNDPNNSPEYIERARKRFVIMRREIQTGEPIKK